MSTTDSTRDQGLNGAVVRQIKAERAAAGLSMSELARRSGLGESSIVRYLTFKRDVTMDSLDKIARGLGMDWQTLVERAMSERQQ